MHINEPFMFNKFQLDQSMCSHLWLKMKSVQNDEGKGLKKLK